jgi:hypothetical protein
MKTGSPILDNLLFMSSSMSNGYEETFLPTMVFIVDNAIKAYTTMVM